ERDEIGRGGLLLAPGNRVQAARGWAVAHETAVGDDPEIRRNRRRELPGGLVGRGTPGREPARIPVGAAPGVHLLGPVRPAVVLEEVEALALAEAGVIV